MKKIGDSTSTANASGEWSEGNPAAGLPATLIKADWLNTIQRELINVVIGGGLDLDPTHDSQVFEAIQAIQTAASTWAKLSGKPTTVAGFGITDAFTKPETTTAIQQAITALVASSPAALDTLKELATALGNDPNFATTMTNALAGKAAKATTLAGYGITDAFTKPETTTTIQQAISALVASSPAALDTLKELADALGNDPNFAATMTNALAGKANKATTLAGYGIADTYTKADLDTARSAADIDALRINGPCIVTASTLGTLPYAGAIGTLLHQERGSSSGRWQLFNDSVGAIYTRSAQLGSGTWLGWGELQMSSSITFTYLYPNGGSSASPASISSNSRYVESNPFGSAPVICIPQILVSGVWETVAVTSPGTAADNTYGVLAAGRAADIIVRTGTGGLATSGAISGIGTYPTQPASNITSAQCRVQVWRIKG